MALDTKVGGIYVELSAISKEFDKGMRNASDQLNDFDRQAENTKSNSGKSFDKLSGTAQVAFGNIIANAVQVGIGAMRDFVLASADTVISYEKQLKSIKAVGGLTVEQIKAVDQANKDLAKGGLFSPEQVAQGAEIFIKAGMPLEKLLSGGLADGLTLATAGEISMDEAAKTVTSSMSAFQREGITTDKIVRIIAGTANATTADVSDLNYALAQSQAVASAMGLTFEDTNAIIGTFAQNGLQGSDAGTSLKTMLMRLQPTTEAQENAMRKLGIITKDGTNQFFDHNGQIKSAAEIQEILQKSTEGLTDAEKQAALTTIFGSDAVRGAIILANSQKGSIQDLKAEMMKVDPYNLATEKTEGFAGAMAKLKNTIEVIKINTFTTLFEKLTPVIDKFTTFLVNNQDNIINFFNGIGTAFNWLADNGHIVIPILSGLIAMVGQMIAPSIIAGIMALGTAIKFFFTSFGWVGLAVTAIVLIIMNWDTIVKYFKIAVEAIGGFVSWLWDNVKTAFLGIWNAVKDNITKVIQFFQPVIDVINYFIQVGLYYLKEVFMAVFNFIKDIIVGFVQGFINDLRILWNFMSFVAGILFRVFVQPVIDGFKTLWNAVSGVFTNIKNTAGGVASALANIFGGITSGIGNVVIGVVKGVINGIISIINAAIRGINGLIDKIPEIPGIKKPEKLGEIPRLNDGGKVQKGSPYFVGDNPDGTLNATSELFIPSTSGRIVSNSDMLNMLGKSGGVVQNITIQSTIFDKNTVAEFYRKTKTLAREAGFELS